MITSLENRYYIYIFLDPRIPGNYKYGSYSFEYEPFYVGKGTRFRINDSLKRGSKRKMSKISKIKESKLDVISIKLIDNLNNDESYLEEIRIIDMIGRIDLNNGPLINSTNGGDYFNIEYDDKYRNEFIKSQIGELNPFYGRTHSYDTKNNQSLKVSGTNHPNYNKKHSEDIIQKIKTNRSKNINQSELNKISSINNSKIVIQYDMNGNFINEFKSIREASKYLNMSESMIGRICRRVVKPSIFIFEFKYDKDKIYRNSYKYKINDIINIFDKDYILYKRTKNTCVLIDSENNLYNFRKKEYSELWDKNSI